MNCLYSIKNSFHILCQIKRDNLWCNLCWRRCLINLIKNINYFVDCKLLMSVKRKQNDTKPQTKTQHSTKNTNKRANKKKNKTRYGAQYNKTLHNKTQRNKHNNTTQQNTTKYIITQCSKTHQHNKTEHKTKQTATTANQATHCLAQSDYAFCVPLKLPRLQLMLSIH